MYKVVPMSKHEIENHPDNKHSIMESNLKPFPTPKNLVGSVVSQIILGATYVPRRTIGITYQIPITEECPKQKILASIKPKLA